MARASAAAENAALNGLDGTGSVNTMKYVSLHVGDPALTGANENPATGGYARQGQASPSIWAAASGGFKANSSQLTFSTLGTTAISHFGTFDALTAGNYAIGGQLTNPVTAASIIIAAGAISIGAS